MVHLCKQKVSLPKWHKISNRCISILKDTNNNILVFRITTRWILLEINPNSRVIIKNTMVQTLTINTLFRNKGIMDQLNIKIIKRFLISSTISKILITQFLLRTQKFTVKTFLYQHLNLVRFHKQAKSHIREKWKNQMSSSLWTLLNNFTPSS